ncbi:coniferyl aldehyde dehydrogenase [Luteimonas sp. 3794]|uniref:coniferyl aldehyde dehydrogenase n=1 Tax=Luteimonas sp. 3794 TaxID=2817730 RepID=UPI002856C090|nr:coniferyl aldehyde dehydrogenase [Luteimonas sp. 3794]MDR6992245.1 coniferyl-aldehyde dehydrogenase [Luteimonas sp. 3794]
MDAALPASTPLADLQPTLDALRAVWRSHRPDAAQRRDDLARLRAAFARRLDEMADAISADFGHRARAESLIADGMTVLSEIDALRGHLRGWMRPRRVGAGWKLWPARAEVRPVPLGVVGVIAPWNYPVNLALIPLATAIAAGNHVYLKPSEHTPRSSAFLRSLLAEVFPPDRVAVALGDADIGAAFAGLPFDHLVFTGSTAVGRKVMAAAAPNLTPLTLELGGKSPAIVCPGYPLDKAASRLVTGKLFNAGQTCIAPDYVLVDAARRDALLEALRFEVQGRYADAGARAADYTHIVSDAQHARLTGLIDDARARGLTVLPLLEVEGTRALAPTLIVEPGDDAEVMGEEIFGPILPVLSYRTLDEAIAFVEARDRPLALYPFGDRAQAEVILARAVAGGVTVNDTLLHFAANRLPFGGVGPSGMGAYHGRAGFDAMTKALPVLWQSRFAVSDWLRPPYARIATLIDRLVR